jgi:hypothetical protein
MKLLKDIFRENNTNKYSFSRVVGTLILIWSMCVSTYLSIQKNEFVDIPASIAMIIIGLYGINKLGEVGYAINSKTADKQDKS